MTKKEGYIASAIMIAIGVCLIALRGKIIEILLTAMGVTLIVSGIIDAVQRKDAVLCTIKCIIGAVLIVGGWLFLTVMLYIVGAMLVIFGVLWIIKLAKRYTKGATVFETIRLYFVPALCVLVGVCLFFNGTAIVDLMFIIAGVLLVVDGIIYLVNVIKEKR